MTLVIGYLWYLLLNVMWIQPSQICQENGTDVCTCLAIPTLQTWPINVISLSTKHSIVKRETLKYAATFSCVRAHYRHPVRKSLKICPKVDWHNLCNQEFFFSIDTFSVSKWPSRNKLTCCLGTAEVLALITTLTYPSTATLWKKNQILFVKCLNVFSTDQFRQCRNKTLILNKFDVFNVGRF